MMPVREPATSVANDATCIRHVVLIGDALGELARSLQREPGSVESKLVPGRREAWRLTLLPAGDVVKPSLPRELPADATHVVISIEGNCAIESSELLRGRPASYEDALARLSFAADQFEGVVQVLIRASQAARLPTVICTMWPPRHPEPTRQRAASAALAIFNDRILRRAVEARLPIVDLRAVCTEAEDFAGPTLLSRAGLAKAANTVWLALYEVSRRGPGAEVFC